MLEILKHLPQAVFNRDVQFHYKYGLKVKMKSSMDPDQLAT